MYDSLLRFFTWCLQKLALYTLVLVLAWALIAWWILQQGAETTAQHREARLEWLATAAEGWQAKINVGQAQLADLQEERTLIEQRHRQAERAHTALSELDSLWERWLGNRAQQLLNDENRERLAALMNTTEKQRRRLRAEEFALEGKLHRWTAALATVEQEHALHLRLGDSAVAGYGVEAYFRARWWLLGLLGLCVLGPTLVKAWLYFQLAPWIVRGRPVRLAQPQAWTAAAGTPAPQVEVALWPGEKAYLQTRLVVAADGALRRRTRLCFDWSLPLTSLACRLTGLLEFRNQHVGDAGEITLADAQDERTVLLPVDVPEGASLIVRPRFLAAVVMDGERAHVLRKRWQVARWQAWVTREFWFFECSGPCRVMLQGRRGLRAERLEPDEHDTRATRRVQARRLLAFSPGLDYAPVRAVSFWRYWRGQTPLFHSLLAGEGLMIVQDKVRAAAENKPATTTTTARLAATAGLPSGPAAEATAPAAALR